MRARGWHALRTAAWTVLLLGAAFADDPLATARRLAEEGRAQAAAAEYAMALCREGLTPEERATARYQRALLLERELGRPEEALEEYRRYLGESSGVLPRTTRIVEEKVWELEAVLGPDGELRRELERYERGEVEGTAKDVRRLQELLRAWPGSRSLAKGYLILAQACQGPAVADWKLSLRALDLARAHGADKEVVEGWRAKANREFFRSRIHAGCVALAAFLVSATLCLFPWTAMRREDWGRAMRLAVPGLVLAAGLGVLYLAGAKPDPENRVTPIQGTVLLAMAVVVHLDSTLLAAALRGRPLALVAVPASALLLSLAGVGIFCWRFDYFHLFGL